MNFTSRRGFLTTASATAASTAALAGTHAKAAPSDRTTLCIIGVRGRGMSLAREFARLPNAQITHICDINRAQFEPASNAIQEIQKSKPQPVQDIRQVLADKSIDAIVVATPDHWHALATIWGCQAGKHVYVEKPISHNVFEGLQMIQAARNYNRSVQVGTQSRSVPHYLEAIEYLRSGKLGRVHMAKAWNSQLRRRVPAVADSTVPEGIDWNLWQGPAAEQTYNENRYTYGWRWLWDYGTGDMGNDGVHDLDIARWGLDVDYPTEVQCTGDKLEFVGDIQQTPDTQIAVFKFPENKILVYEQRLWSPYFQEGFENGVAFYGTEGYMLIGRKSWTVVEKRNKTVIDQKVDFSDRPHLENFVAAIQTSAKLNCDIEQGYRSTLLAHLGNLSFRVGRPLRFDSASQSIIDDSAANQLLKRLGRKEFLIPEQV
jgi:predicted dehydrogenase